MKLCFLFILLGMLSATAKTIAQNQVVSLNLKNVTYLELFNELHRKTGIRFLYSSDQLEDLSRIDVVADQRKISEVLEEALQGTRLTCVFEEDMVMLKFKQEQQQKKLYRIEGRILDGNRQPLVGATVVLKGTFLGTSTDVEGHFSINVLNPKDTLVISSVGYKTKSVFCETGRPVTVVLEEEVASLDEVVVTGIFNKSKETYTGAVTVVTDKQLKMFAGQNLLQTLKNIDPAFNVMTNNEFGSDPNKLPEITIRGNASLPTNLDDLNSEIKAELNAPLIIMDGFEISLQKLMDFNDEEIESITLLKDASATAIYGSRGANGIVVVTTKEPTAGKLKVALQAGMNLEIPDLTSYDLVNAAQKLELEKAQGYYESSMGAYESLRLKQAYDDILRDVIKGVNTDWLAQPLHVGIGQRYNLRLSGGSREFLWGVSLGYNNIAGAMKGSLRNNFSGTINLSYDLKNISFRNQTMYTINHSENSPYGSFSDYVKMNPYWRIYDDKGELIPSYTYLNNMNPVLVGNPLYNATLNSFDESESKSITNNFSLEWKIIERLILRAEFGISSGTSTGDVYKSPEHTDFAKMTGVDYFRRGTYSYQNGESMNYDGKVTLNYSKVFAEKHQVYAGLNYSVGEDKSSSYSFKVEGYTNPNLNFLPNGLQYADVAPSGNESCSRRVGFTGNVNYSYDSRFFVDGSFRVDGSSQFGANQKFAPFWSVGLGWNIHKEKFLADSRVISNLKIRGSYGVTGSQNFSSYQSLLTYKYYTDERYVLWNGAYIMGLGNKDLKWQNTYQYNLGVDVALWNRRISLNMDFYIKDTDNLLSNMDLPASHGFDSYTENVGKVRNKGIEASLNFYVIRNTQDRIMWSFTSRLSYDNNKIMKLSDKLKAQSEAYKYKGADVNLLFEGDSQYAMYAVPSLGIDPSTGREIFRKPDGTITFTWDPRDKVNVGLSQPKVRMNYSSMFAYKNLTVNLSFASRLGGMAYNRTLIDRVEAADFRYNVDKRVYEDRWQKPGDVKFFKSIYDDSKTQMSSRFIQKENTFELQSLSVSYKFAGSWLKKMKMQSCVVGYNMSDVFYISTIKRERGTSYPFARNANISLNVMF